MKRSVTWKHRLEYAAFQIVLKTIGNLPLGSAADIGGALARFIGMRTTLRRRAEWNLAYALPELSDDERAEILSGMFDCLTRTIVEFRYLRRLSAEPGRYEISGLEHLDAARARGKGAILATGHFGNWEMIRIAIARHGWPPALIYRAFNNPLFDDKAAELMRVTNAPVLHKGRRGSLGLVRHVRAGGCALILTDQRFSRAPELPFFGHPAKTSLGASEIALNYGAALLPVRCERVGRTSKFRIVIEPAVDIEGKTAEAVMTEINARLESWVRSFPEQYFWMHNRWAKDPQKRSRQ